MNKLYKSLLKKAYVNTSIREYYEEEFDELNLELQSMGLRYVDENLVYNNFIILTSFNLKSNVLVINNSFNTEEISKINVIYSAKKQDYDPLYDEIIDASVVQEIKQNPEQFKQNIEEPALKEFESIFQKISSIVISEKTLEAFLDELFVNSDLIYSHKPYSRDSKEDKEGYTGITEEAITSKGFEYQIPKYFIDVINYSGENLEIEVTEYEEYTPETEESSYEEITERDFDAAQFAGLNRSEVFDKAYKEISAQCFSFIESYKKSTFYNSQNSKIIVDKGNFLNLVLFGEKGKTLDQYEPSGKANITFISNNECYIEFFPKESGNYDEVKLWFKLSTKEITPDSKDKSRSDIKIIPDIIPGFNANSTFSFLRERLDYLAFKFLSLDQNASSPILASYITSSKIKSSAAALSGASEEGTSKHQLQYLVNKVLGRVDSNADEISLEVALQRSASPFRAIVSNDSFEDVNENIEYATRAFSKKSFYDTIKYSPSEGRGASSIGGETLEDIINSSISEDRAKIDSITRLLVPSYVSKIMYLGQQKLTSEYQSSRLSTKDFKEGGISGFLNNLDLSNPIQQQVVATYAKDYILKSWPTVSSGLNATYSELGIPLSQRQKSEFLDSMQDGIIQGLSSTSTSRSLRTASDWGALLNVSQEELFNDFESFKLKYEADVETSASVPSEAQNEAKDFETSNSSLRRLHLKKSISSIFETRIHQLNIIHKIASNGGNVPTFTAIDIVSDSDSTTMAKINSFVSNYSDMIDGSDPYFLPISIDSSAKINLSKIQLNQTNSKSIQIMRKLKFYSKNNVTTQSIKSMVYCSNSGIVMVDEGLELKINGSNIFGPELINYLESNGVKLKDIISENVSGNRNYSISVEFEIEGLGSGTKNKFGLIVVPDKSTGSFRVHVDNSKPIYKYFEDIIPEVERQVMLEFSSERNGLIHRGITESGEIKRNTNFGVDPDLFREWSASNPESFKPMVISYDFDGNIEGLRIGADTQVASSEGEFRARYNKSSKKMIDASKSALQSRDPIELYDPRNSSFYGNNKDISLEELRINSLTNKNPSSLVPNLLEIKDLSPKNKAILNLYDPITRMSFEAGIASSNFSEAVSLTANKYSDRYTYIRNGIRETNQNSMITSLLELKQNLKTVSANDLFKGDLNDIQFRVLTANAEINEKIILESCKYRSFLSQKDQLSPNEKSILYIIDSVLIDIKNTCLQGDNRLFSKISISLQFQAPWLSSSNILSFSDEEISFDRSTMGENYYESTSQRIDTDRFKESRQLNKKISKISLELKGKKDLDVFRSDLRKNIDTLNFSNKSFEHKRLIVMAILSQLVDDLPNELNIKTMDQNIIKIVDHESFTNIFSESDIERLKSFSKVEKIKLIGDININSIDELEEFLLKNKELDAMLKDSRSNVKNSFQQIYNILLQENDDLKDFKKYIDAINQEYKELSGFSQKGLGLYISESVIKNYIGKEIYDMNLKADDIAKAMQSMTKSYSGGPGILFEMLSDYEGDNYFYNYLIKNSSAEEFSAIKIAILEKVQPLNNLSIETLDDGSKRYSIKSKPPVGSMDGIKYFDIKEGTLNLDEATKSFRSYIELNPERAMRLSQNFGQRFLSPKELFEASVGSIKQNYLDSIDVEKDERGRLKITLKEDANTINYIDLDGNSVVLNRLGEGSGPEKTPKVHIKSIYGSPKISESILDIVSRKNLDKQMFEFLLQEEPLIFYSEIKVNLLGVDNEGKSIFSISIGNVFETNPQSIDQLNDYGGKYNDDFIKMVKESLKDSGIPKESLSDYDSFKYYLNSKRKDAESLDKLRMADLERGVRSFAMLYDPSISQALSKSLKSVESLAINKDAKDYIQIIKSFMNESTGKIVSGGIDVKDRSYAPVKSLYKDLKPIREHYNLNKYSNPEISKAIIDKISKKFPNSTKEEVAELLFYMGFKTSVSTSLTPLVATARVTLSIKQLEALKDNLLIIEKIQTVRSNMGSKDKTDEGFAKLVKERVFGGRDKILLESTIDGNKKEISSLEELIDFMMKEIEYLEDMGNVSLSSSFRSNLYSSLNYNASTVRVQVGGTFFGKRMTENGNFFFSFLGKLGIVSDDDIKRAIDLIESSKELRSEIIAAEEELMQASKNLSQEMRKNLPNASELIEAAEINYQEKLNKLQELERKAETISISELDLQRARDGLSKAGKGLRFAEFLKNFSIACINPLNSMEFAALGLAIDAGSILSFKLVPAVYKLIFDKIFRDKLFDKTKSYIEILKGLGDNSLLDEEIIGFAPEESKTNKYLRSVEEKTIESRKTGSASRRLIRDAQSSAMNPKATTFKWTKDSSKEYEVIFSKQMKNLMSGRIAATIKAALKVFGKILAKIFIALYAKSLWDNVTGDQVEVGIVYPGEISHNISQAFTKMKDHTFKSYSCEERGECDSTIFNENHKFDLGGSDSSLYSKILRSDGIGEIQSHIKKIRSCKQSLRSIVNETLTEENINRNLNINFDLATDAMFASVEETTTLLAEVLPMLLSSAAEENIRFCSRYYTGEDPGNTITQEAVGFISYYITYVPLKIIGLILSFANAVDVISHAANNLANKYLPYDYTPDIMYPDKLRPCRIAFDKESLDVFDSMIEEICLSLESTCIYKFLKANSTLDIQSRDPALTDILSKYDLAFSSDYLE